jgi:hypothetical protein
MCRDCVIGSRKMLAGLCLFTFAFLLLGGSAGASIGRTQSFDIGALNRVQWAGGIGSARGDNQASFTQSQQFSDRCSGLSATQTGRGSLTQTATASGTGLSTARQTAAIRGSQDLLGETTRPLTGRAMQDLGVRLDTRLFKPGGTGAVNGTQSYTGAQEQSLATPSSRSSQSQSVDIRQSGSINTEVNTDPAVRNTVTVDLHQSQITNGQPPHWQPTR